jgi:hypothetical protein
MKRASEIMAEPQLTIGSTPQTFSDQEKDSTIYLMTRMTAIWGSAKMSSLYPDDKAKMLARRQYAKRIGQYDRQQIDQALNYMAEKKSNDNHFEWPSIDDALGVLKDLNRKRPLHQEYKRIESQPVTPEQHEKYMAELRAIVNG